MSVSDFVLDTTEHHMYNRIYTIVNTRTNSCDPPSRLEKTERRTKFNRKGAGALIELVPQGNANLKS